MALTIELAPRKKKQQLDLDAWYGVEWDSTLPNPSCKRIGKIELHKSLPVQSKMKRCILKDDGNVAYYLDPNDSSLKADGTRADLTGADGQYMVELPEVYVRFEEDGNICRAMMSEHPLPGFTRWGKDYVSVAEATMDGTSNTLSSVVGQLGTSNMSLTAFRTAARRRGSRWNCYTYQIHRKLYWFFVVEYATRNSQEAFKPQLTPEGFRQGGLGKGSIYCGSRIIPIGATIDRGNGTSLENDVVTYRGIQNIVGHTFKYIDGVVFANSCAWICEEPDLFKDVVGDGYSNLGNVPSSGGWVKKTIFGSNGNLVGTEYGASDNSYFACQETYLVANGVLIQGGYDSYRQINGFTRWSSSSSSFRDLGTRLSYIPKETTYTEVM